MPQYMSGIGAHTVHYSVQCTWMSGGETRPILLPLLQLLQATVGFYAEILISVWVGVPCIK